VCQWICTGGDYDGSFPHDCFDQEGVGKTTLAVNLAALPADIGQRMLLVNAGPQLTLSSCYNRHATTTSPGRLMICLLQQDAHTQARWRVLELHLAAIASACGP
jgi:anion-transporting  ArsA/GET3 family ATPase